MDQDMEDDMKRVEWLQSEQYSAAGDIFGEPQKTTRVGNEYQAQIPSLMSENERLQFMKLPFYHDFKTDDQNHPITWVHNQHKYKEDTMEIQSDAKGESGIVGSGTDGGLLLVSCSSAEESWSMIEHDSFLLALYIFGKNLRAVKKFMGNKGLQNIMSYYYGIFYRSTEHQKWSMYRKKNNRKSIPGKKIFKGWRRQELLSRLLPNVTDECKTRLTEISSMFDEGEVSFENYLLSLRDAVGIDLLVEAVAIGKEKRDLITKARKRVRNKKTHTACSSLKTEEIVNILKDRIGLCKTRLNELFWEAVWPRLLARGWHSEQPRNYALQNSKQSLVFLAPGVAKFSRRSLVKGSQYFDSFNDVLNKVASEPQLLEHKSDQDTLAEPHAKQDSDDEQDVLKYIVVDTSFVGLVKFKELTSLPVSSISADTEHETTEESQNDDVNHNTKENNGFVDSPDCEMKISTNGQPLRKLKVVFKPKAKHHRGVKNIKKYNMSGEDETKDDESYEKKRPRIVIDLNSPRVAHASDGDSSLCSTKHSLSPETTSCNQRELSSPGANGQRHSTRNRPLTTKALEALANGFLSSKKKKRGSEDGTHRHVRAKTALVLSCGERYIENNVDGVSHLVNESPK